MSNNTLDKELLKALVKVSLQVFKNQTLKERLHVSLNAGSKTESQVHQWLAVYLGAVAASWKLVREEELIETSELVALQIDQLEWDQVFDLLHAQLLHGASIFGKAVLSLELWG